MAQFDVYENINEKTNKQIPFLSELFKKTPMSTHGDELKKFLRK